MTSALSPLVRKEVRALAPTWMATAGILALAGVTGFPAVQSTGAAVPRGSMQMLGTLAFVLGALTLGAMSVGHEYAHRTLAQLLAQPEDRARLFRIKRAVLALYLLALTGVATVTILRDVPLTPAAVFRMGGALLIVVPVLAFCVAPWLTMVCRNPLAGLVFTLAIPVALAVASLILAPALATALGSTEDAIGLGVLWAGVVGTTLVATGTVTARLGRRLFMRLEARDGQGDAPVMPLRRAATYERATSAGGRRLWAGPLAALVRKELRLQTFTLACAALYVVTLTALLLLAPTRFVDPILFGVTVQYAGLVATLAGAIPSAEERALGTLEWQTLQPQTASMQWAIKVTMAVALTVTLAFGLPLLLETLHPRVGHELLSAFRLSSARTVVGYPSYGAALTALHAHSLIVPAAALALLTVCGLYLSSLCTGGLRALLLTWPLAACAFVLPSTITRAASRAAWQILGMQSYVDAAQRALDEGRPFASWISRDGGWWVSQSALWLQVVAIGGLIVLLLRLGFLNHRFAERDRPRIVRQLALLALFVVVTAVLQGAVPVLVLRAFAIMR